MSSVVALLEHVRLAMLRGTSVRTYLSTNPKTDIQKFAAILDLSRIHNSPIGILVAQIDYLIQVAGQFITTCRSHDRSVNETKVEVFFRKLPCPADNPSPEDDGDSNGKRGSDSSDESSSSSGPPDGDLDIPTANIDVPSTNLDSKYDFGNAMQYFPGTSHSTCKYWGRFVVKARFLHAINGFNDYAVYPSKVITSDDSIISYDKSTIDASGSDKCDYFDISSSGDDEHWSHDYPCDKIAPQFGIDFWRLPLGNDFDLHDESSQDVTMEEMLNIYYSCFNCRGEDEIITFCSQCGDCPFCWCDCSHPSDGDEPS